MSRYAESTSVTSEASRAEIERTLARYGAASFMYGWDADTAVIRFRAADRFVEFRLELPARSEFAFTEARRVRRSAEAQAKAYDQAVRQRWRALALVIKAKLEAVAAGITVFEDEFLAHILLPDGQTVGDFLRPQLAQSYDIGRMPTGLLGLPAAGETS